MKGRSFFFMALLSLIAGVVLIITYTTVSSAGLVVLGGVLFIAAGILNFVLYAGSRRGRDGASRRLMPVTLSYLTSGAAVLLGLSMLVFKTTFVAVIPYLFCMLMILAAVIQLLILLPRQGRMLFSSWFLLIPVALAGVGIYIASLPAGSSDAAIMLAGGIGLVVNGLALAVEGVAVSRQAAAAVPTRDGRQLREDEGAVTPSSAVKPLDGEAK